MKCLHVRIFRKGIQFPWAYLGKHALKHGKSFHAFREGCRRFGQKSIRFAVFSDASSRDGASTTRVALLPVRDRGTSVPFHVFAQITGEANLANFPDFYSEAT